MGVAGPGGQEGLELAVGCRACWMGLELDSLSLVLGSWRGRMESLTRGVATAGPEGTCMTSPPARGSWEALL